MGDTHVSAPTDKMILREKERVERRLAHAWALYEDAVWRIAKDAQDKIVNPFLDANPDMALRISGGGGRYALYRDGSPWYMGEESSDIFDLLEVEVEGYDRPLGAWMMAYPAWGDVDD